MVEDYLDAHLRTPDLPKDDIARALGARGWAWKGAGRRFLLVASRGQSHSFVVIKTLTVFYHPIPSLRRLSDSFNVRPFNRDQPLSPGTRCPPYALQYLKHGLSSPSLWIHFSGVPAPLRLPPENWDQIASFISRYFLLTWLFVSSFHRDTS